MSSNQTGVGCTAVLLIIALNLVLLGVATWVVLTVAKAVLGG